MRPVRQWLWCAVALAGPVCLAGPVFLAGSAAAAHEQAPPRVERLLVDGSDGRLDEHGLFEAVLIASGVEGDEAYAAARDQFGALCSRLQDQSADLDSPRALARGVFDFLHREILRGKYRVECTNPLESLVHGDYNCVSSAVLYNCLAAAVGLDVRAVETPGHAFSRLFDRQGTLDIQTTCPTWFEILDDKTRQADALRGIAGALPADAAPAERVLDEVQLTAIVFYNRGVDFLEAEEFSAAVAANARALRLDAENKPARGNLLASYNNWALSRCQRKDFATAVELIEQGRRLDPQHRTFAVNDLAVHQQWVSQLTAAGQFAAALDALERAHRRAPRERYFDAGRLDVLRRWAAAALEQGHWNEAKKLCLHARQRFGDRPEWQESEAGAVHDAAQSLLASGRAERARLVYDLGLQLQPASRFLQLQRRRAESRTGS